MTQQQKTARLESYKRLISIGLVLICLALETAVFGWHWYYHFRFNVVTELQLFYFKGHVLEISIYLVILTMFSTMYGGFKFGYSKTSELVFSQMFATLMADVLIYAELSVMAFGLFPVAYIAEMVFVQFILVLVYITLANFIYGHIFQPRKLLLIYGDRDPSDLCRKFATRLDRYVITRKIHVDEGATVLCDTIKEVMDSGECDAVVIGDISDIERKPIIKYCYANFIRFYMMPKINDVIMMGTEELHVFDSPFLLNYEYALSMEQRAIKRFADILFSLILIIVSSPFMLLTGIAVKVYDHGPVFYKQVRCTIGGREFKIIKFRSMRVDAEKDGKAVLASKGDPRITPVGKFIRKCRLDELPQLFNILKGDMSFIGPRPERPEIIKQYAEVMPEWVFRMRVKAGLAGFAQIYGKYNTTPYDKLKLDLIYIQNYSLLLDLKLMLLTLKILFMPDSTEGVEAGQLTALKEETKFEHDAPLSLDNNSLDDEGVRIAK